MRRFSVIRMGVVAGALALVAVSCGGSAGAETPTSRPAGASGSMPGTAEPSVSQGLARASLPAGTVVSTAPQPQLRDAIGIGMMSGQLVVETPQSILVVDQATGTVTEEIPMPDLPQINGFLLTDGALWILDHDAGKVVRVDPTSGEVVAEIVIGGRAVSLLETPEGIWAGSAHVTPQTLSLIDPATNSVTRTLELGAFPVYDGQHLWFGRDETGAASTIRQVDPATGEIVSSIDLDGAEGCYLGGRFPDVVWSWCFEPWPTDTDATRLDLADGVVATTIPLDGSGGLVGVTDAHSWFFSDRSGDVVLLRVDNRTNAIEAAFNYEMGPNTIVGEALWIVDLDAGEVRVVELPAD
jgi:DNA-binding beta-propeller fold protein YncE